MKTIGMIGGMSWESTISYYKLINEHVKKELGGLHSAKILLYSVEFSEIEALQSKGEWNTCAIILRDVAQKLEQAGADFIVICTNTMHKVVPLIQPHIQIPILHIAQATASKLQHDKITKVGLLGTKYTMQESFYTDTIEHAKIEVVLPNDEDIEIINRIIFEELCLGNIREEARLAYLKIIDKMKVQGAQGVILGCTEIGLLIHQEDCDIPVFDTTSIHAIAAARKALE